MIDNNNIGEEQVKNHQNNDNQTVKTELKIVKVKKEKIEEKWSWSKYFKLIFTGHWFKAHKYRTSFKNKSTRLIPDSSEKLDEATSTIPENYNSNTTSTYIKQQLSDGKTVFIGTSEEFQKLYNDYNTFQNIKKKDDEGVSLSQQEKDEAAALSVLPTWIGFANKTKIIVGLSILNHISKEKNEATNILKEQLQKSKDENGNIIESTIEYNNQPNQKEHVMMFAAINTKEVIEDEDKQRYSTTCFLYGNKAVKNKINKIVGESQVLHSQEEKDTLNSYLKTYEFNEYCKKNKICILSGKSMSDILNKWNVQSLDNNQNQIQQH